MSTTKLQTDLLASAGSIEGIEKMINRYFFSSDYTVDPITMNILHPKLPTGFNDGFRVVLKRGRYRFEAILKHSSAFSHQRP